MSGHGFEKLGQILVAEDPDPSDFDEMMACVDSLDGPGLLDVADEMQVRLLMMARQSDREDEYGSYVQFLVLTLIALARRGELDFLIKEYSKRFTPKTGDTTETEETIKQRILKLHHDRWTYEQIAQEVGKSTKTVGRIVRASKKK